MIELRKFLFPLDNKKFFFVSLIFVVSTLPFSYRLNSFAIILSVIAWFFQKNYRNLPSVFRNTQVLLFIAPYILLVSGMLYTSNTSEGLFELEKQFSLLLFPLLLATSPRMEIGRMYFLLKAFVAANLIAGITCLSYAAYMYYTKSINLFFYHYLVEILGFHAGYFTMYCILSVIILVHLYVKNGKNYSLGVKSVTIAMVFFFSFLVLLLSTRYLIIVYLLGALIGIIYFTIKTKKIIQGFFFLFFFIFMNYVAINSSATNIKERISHVISVPKYEFKPDNSYNGFTLRLAQWELGYKISRQNSFMGLGTGDVQDELQKTYQEHYLTFAYDNRYNVHNQYLQTLLGLGIPGILMLLISFLYPGIMAFREKKYLYVLFLTLFCLYCINESLLSSHRGVVFYAFFNSLFAFHYLKSPLKLTRKG